MTHWRLILVLWVIGIAIWAPMLVPAAYWYELRSLNIEDSVAGMPSRIGADRSVYRDFTGEYSVRIMTFPDNELVCVAGPYGPFPYRKVDTDLIIKDLAWWLRDFDAFNNCESAGMTSGQFVAVTNHTILRPWPAIPWVARVETADVVSNVFTIFPTEVPPVEQIQKQQVEIEQLKQRLDVTE